MKIAYLSEFDPLNVLSWSGCSYYLAKALAENHSVSLDFIGPLSPHTSTLFDLKTRVYRVLGKNYLPTVDPRSLKHYAGQAAAALANSDADFILSLDAIPIAYLEIAKPIIYFWDSTFLGNLEYPWFKNLAPESIRYGHQMEQLALNRCQFAAFSSEWAMQTAIRGYGVDSRKLRLVPLGANLDCNRTIEDVTRMVDSRSVDRCDLLFLGVDWVRKGGDVAYDVAKQLNARGLPTTLTIVGCQPEVTEPLPPFVRSLGFINKFENNNHKIIETLLSESHFLIVPSIAESFGAVFCEASSFGTPSLARSVGGIPTAVKNGVNGRLFSRDAAISEYCDYILGLFKNYSKYKSLARASFEEYQARLNWKQTSQTIIELFQQLA